MATSAALAEDFLRLGALLLPGPLRKAVGDDAAEVVSETLLTLANLVQTLEDAASGDKLRSVASFLGAVDVLVELYGRQFGGREGRWRAIVAVELIRAVLKLFIHARSRVTHRLLVADGRATAAAAPMPSSAGQSVGWWQGSFSGLVLPLPPSAKPASPPPAPVLSTWATSVESLKSLCESAATALRAWMTDDSSIAATTQSQHVEGIVAAPAGPPPPTSSPLEAAAAELAKDPGSRASTSYPAVSCASATGSLCRDQAQPLFDLAEILYIMRPLIYAISRRNLGSRSWLPLALSLLMDATSARLTHVAGHRSVGDRVPVLPVYLSRVLRSLAGGAQSAADVSPSPGFLRPPAVAADDVLTSAMGAPGAGVAGLLIRFALSMLTAPPGMSAAEEAEVRRRRLMWLLYLLRPPVFHSATLPMANRVARAGAAVPLLATLLQFGRDMLVYAASHYFHTSAS